MERRLAALRVAKAREAEDAARRAEEDKARDEERARKREEAETKEREERAREAAARAKAEEEERLRLEAAAEASAKAAARKAMCLAPRAVSRRPRKNRQSLPRARIATLTAMPRRHPPLRPRMTR